MSEMHKNFRIMLQDQTRKSILSLTILCDADMLLVHKLYFMVEVGGE